MFEKVNPSQPDKLADRIAGAIVDLAYAIEDNPKIAVVVLLVQGGTSYNAAPVAREIIGEYLGVKSENEGNSKELDFSTKMN